MNTSAAPQTARPDAERAYNFAPGPCALPDAVMARARDEFLVYGGERASVFEISHRGAAFMGVYQSAVARMRKLLAVPDSYEILFLTGGATGQAAAVPLNLLGDNTQAAYVTTGLWGQKALVEGRRYGEMAEIANSGEEFRRIPAPEDWHTPPTNCAYVHYVDNETVHGVEFAAAPQVKDEADESPVLVCDMSSNIASRPMRVEDFGLVYAGAQKNLAPSGLTVVIVRRDLFARGRGRAPIIWDYAQQAQQDSMANTPPTFQIYMLDLVLEWLEAQGGVAAMGAVNEKKAAAVYAAIDENGGFYRNPVEVAARSRMNIPFFLADDNLTAEFLSGAADEGMVGLKGHAVVGGCRASLYNALPLEAAENLSAYMREFARKRG